MKILIVEDEIIIAEDLKLTLQGFGHEIISIVSSGEDAIIYADNFLPDMIIMDIVLEGEISGIDAALLIKKKHNIPIIFCTAFVDMITRNVTSKFEPSIFISKPIEEHKIQVALNNLVQYNHSAM
jgi:CheY-like chemotaxis protein